MSEQTALVTYDHHQTKRDWLTIQNPAIELANAIAGTEFVPAHFRNNPAAIAAAILYGDEVGLGPMQSLAKIAVINGRPTLAAEAQRALILQAGHDLWIEESTPTRCTVGGRRRGSEATSRITWTMDDAKRANLAGKPPWKLYPRQMLLARATSDLARAVFPDAIGGLASTEELDDGGAAAGPDAATAASAATATTRRRRANVSAGGGEIRAVEPAPPVEAERPPDLPPLPGEDDEPAPPEDPTDPEGVVMISDAQRRKIQAMFRERGITDRQERLTYSSAAIGRLIETSNDLTWQEASELIDVLEGEPPPTPASEPPAGEFATLEQRERLYAVRDEAGVSDFRLREILQEVTGQQLTSQIPADRFYAVLAAVIADGPPTG